ncbi:hypothetical protein Bca52824_036935 [Brassica carinata]|uniref:Uncharacterized protein n=1 Tax=Brassica carinata TaxID=52824 RepID=A0A8X7S688_BRACI|nr:hypothetical protein Bca52824_036935 [Brassica carinata]
MVGNKGEGKGFLLGDDWERQPLAGGDDDEMQTPEKEIDKVTTPFEVVNERLPMRLSVTDCFPSWRLNVYSKMDYLLFIIDVLEGTPEMNMLFSSCFVNVMGSCFVKAFSLLITTPRSFQATDSG